MLVILVPQFGGLESSSHETICVLSCQSAEASKRRHHFSIMGPLILDGSSVEDHPIRSAFCRVQGTASTIVLIRLLRMLFLYIDGPL